MRFWFSLLVLILSLKVSSACECPPLKPISTELCRNYNVIFYGTVDSISACGKDGISTVFFSIIELYKGAVSKNVKIDFDCASPCLMSFEKGEEWLIYSSYPAFDKLTVNLCEHSRKYIADASKDFYTITSQRSFMDEKQFLFKELGIQSFVVKNDLNDQQKMLKPHNEQPSGLNKLFLLLISVAVMGVVFFVAKRRK